MSERTVYIGTCGWQYPQWNDSYYPESLPQDWQLAYYGNEYPIVLIPASDWSLGRDVIENWLAETDDRPRFICEWTFECDTHGQESALDLIGVLGERVDGVLVRLAEMPDAAQLDMLNRILSAYPVCLDWPYAESAQLQSLQSQITGDASVCWHGDVEHAEDLSLGPLALARVTTDGQTPRSLRAILEALLAHAGERQAVLLFDGQPPDLEVVDQAEVILNLL